MTGTKFKQIEGKEPNTENYLAKVAKVESGNNPVAKNPHGSATGLFQFTSGTWQNLNNKYKLNYNLEDRKNPEKAAEVMRLFTKENEQTLKPILGRDLTDSEKYLAHFMGSGGAKKFFTVYGINPNTSISSVLTPKALQDNKSVVYNKNGTLKTVAEIYDWANKKMDIKTSPLIYTPTGENKTNVYQQYLPVKTVDLETSTEKYQAPEEETEDKEVIEAKQELNEKSFIEELTNVLNYEQLPATEPQPEIQLDPSAYNYINEEEYQQGGKVNYQDVKDFYKDYINSPKYLERLQLSGYNNPQKTINKRLNSVNNAKVIIQNGAPGYFKKLYNDLIDKPYSEGGSEHNSKTNTIILDDLEEKEGVPRKSVLAHEYGHSELTGAPLNGKDLNSFYERVIRTKNTDSHDLDPDENKSDINAFRYELKKQGIYDAGRQNIDKNILKKAKDTYIKQRLLKNFSEDNLIYLMNNIALNSKDIQEKNYAQKGGRIIVNNLEDPRLQAYKDSLNMYNKGINQKNKTLKFIKDNNLDPKNFKEFGIKGYAEEGQIAPTRRGVQLSTRDKNNNTIFIDVNGKEKVIPSSESYDYFLYDKPRQEVILKERDKVRPSDITQKEIKNYNLVFPDVTLTPSAETIKTYGSDLFQNVYRANGTSRPGTGKNTPERWDEDVEMVWLKDPEKLGVNRQQDYNYNIRNNTYDNLIENIDFKYVPVIKGDQPIFSRRGISRKK